MNETVLITHADLDTIPLDTLNGPLSINASQKVPEVPSYLSQSLEALRRATRTSRHSTTS